MPSQKRVLYVEDNSANFALVKRILQIGDSYEVLQAHSGPEALETTQAERPDLILLDLDLPEMSGIEVTRRLKGDPEFREIPIVIVTASVMKRERTQALDAGADHFVEKPFDIAELRRLVDQCCGIVSDNPFGH